MSDPLQQLEDWAAPLLRKLTPKGQRDLARAVARELRRSQAARIAAQRAPDGTPYAPRKKAAPGGSVRSRKGRIKTMFAKLRTASHLKLLADPQGAAIGITGRATRIARVHQHGLRDRVQPGGPMVDYPARELLGLTDTEREATRDLILKHLVS